MSLISTKVYDSWTHKEYYFCDSWTAKQWIARALNKLTKNSDPGDKIADQKQYKDRFKLVNIYIRCSDKDVSGIHP